MASTKTKSGKQLGELLQEQQEPFVLDVYLIEKGYLNRSLSSKTGCCNGNPIKLSSRSATSGLNKSRKGFPSCSKALRAIYNKFARSNGSLSTKSSDDKEEGQFSVDIDMGNNGQEVVEIDRFSSASSTTVYNSCPESDKDESPTSEALKLANMGEETAVADGLFLAQYNKQHNPISVLEQIPSEHAQLNVRTRQEESQTTSCKMMIPPHKVTEDSILSTSLRELFFNSSGASESMELLRQSPSAQFVKSKRMLQQTRQLLFDCVREIMETHAKKERGHKHTKQLLGTEEIGELLWEKIKAWSKQAGDDTNNIALLLSLDIFDSSPEWNDFTPEKREIGDAIAQDIMNEIVVEAIEFLAP
ncbi:hypothetical protein UlMin_034912 [Ulmus minor]